MNVQRYRKRLSSDLDCQPRDSEIRDNFVIEQNPVSHTFKLKSQATIVEIQEQHEPPAKVTHALI